MKPYYSHGGITIYHSRALDLLRALPADSVDLIATDPPYFRVKDEAWDRQWKDEGTFLSWIGELCQEWRRVLKANGSLYVFASPEMVFDVEKEIKERFNVLNTIRWEKEEGWHQKAEKETLRSYLSNWEGVIFAEHYGSDNIARGEAGYAAKCEELRGFVFEPLRAYLASELERAGLTVQDIAEAWRIKTGNARRTGMAGHWFSSVQWALPTEENYEWLRATFTHLNHEGEYLRREYEDLRREYEDLRREYEDLRREYEDLRRPFTLSPPVPWSDTWRFPTVQPYPGKHPCEKPLPMMEHIVSASSRPGDVVADFFIGSGTTLEAAKRNGRQAIGCDMDLHWCRWSAHRLSQEVLQFPNVA